MKSVDRQHEGVHSMMTKEDSYLSCWEAGRWASFKEEN
jgi:hypothetical protein